MKMQNQTLMKWLILVGALSSLQGLHAQTFIGSGWTQTGPNVSFGVDTSSGTFVSTAPLNNSVTFPGVEGSTTNPQFLWVPAWGALRAGAFYSAPSTTTMGQYSAALGTGAIASGYGSVAFSGGSALGSDSFAGGGYSTASGSGSMAFGLIAYATGPFSLALGVGATASGGESIALGGGNASGSNAMAFGLNTSAASFDSLAVGTYNIGGGTAGSWVATDPLFEVGNGTSTQRSDALLLDKSGNLKVASVTVTAVSGDIPMYTGN